MADTDSADILFRKALVDDAEALSAFAARSFREAFGAGNDPQDLDTYLASAFSTAVQAAEIADAASTFILAVDGADRLVGYAHLIAASPDVQLKRLYVDAAWHGRGLAAMLMNHAFTQCRQQGAARVWLTVWTMNDRAIAFYRKHGFHVCGSETFVLGSDTQTDHVMEASVA